MTSKAMTVVQLGSLLTKVYMEHNVIRAVRPGFRRIKYVNPVFDNRTGDVFSVTFRWFGGELCLHVCNEQRDLPDSLYDRCVYWLEHAD